MSRQTPGSPQRNAGFSLTEILVVVAIMVILISILVPNLYQAREVARTVVCQSHQGSIMTATLTYTQQNEGFFPPMLYDNGGEENYLRAYVFFDAPTATTFKTSGFDLLIREGWVDADKFRCPSDQENPFPETGPAGSSYGMNALHFQMNADQWGGEIEARKNKTAWLGNQGSYGRGNYGPRMRDILNPSETAYLMEKIPPDHPDQNVVINNNNPIVLPGYAYRYPTHAINRHGQTIIAGMADGSIFVGLFREFYLGVEFIPGWTCEELLARPIADGGTGFVENFANPGTSFTTSTGLKATAYVHRVPRLGGMVHQPFQPQE